MTMTIEENNLITVKVSINNSTYTFTGKTWSDVFDDAQLSVAEEANLFGDAAQNNELVEASGEVACLAWGHCGDTYFA